MSWYLKARSVIAKLDADMPEKLTFQERKKLVQAAYPWGARENHPYKAWCKAQREYLARFDNRPMSDGLFK